MLSPIQFSANVTSKPKRMTLEAVVTRADGTVEHLGIIADSSLPHRIAASVKRILTRLF